jgi:GNAT superfamily N-acetyltransferase
MIERDMTAEELARMNSGFDEHATALQVSIQDSERIGLVALAAGKFVGCASGLAYKHGEDYSGWFYLTDLFVEKTYRLEGIGSNLLSSLEGKLSQKGIDKIWTWTAGYEGPGFYMKQGYVVFAELEHWYSSGHSRIALRKALKL